MAKNCIIYETLQSVKDLKVGHADGLMTLSGVFGVCGIRNNNRRVYETSNYSKMVTEMKQRIKEEGAIPGELEHPQTMNMTLENISHKITDINIDENGEVTGTIALLNTPKGKIAQAIVEGGLPLFISSRATGNIDKTGNVMLEKIATYDLVGTPGFSQAKLHLNENQIAESLNESLYVVYENKSEINENIEDNMDIKELMEKFESLENRIEELESTNADLQEQLDNIETEGTRLNEDQMKKLADGIQKWIVEEYSPELQNWITEEFGEDLIETHKEQVVESVQEKINSFADGIQKWIVEEYSPEVEKWITEEYSSEVEKWITEEYSSEVEKWAKTELATGIQNWIVEEYSPEVENWLNESYSEHIKNDINESKQSSNNLDAVNEVLTVLESIEQNQKPVYKGKSLINENLDEPTYIREMPAEKRVKWDLASQEVKESINRRAKLYNFMTEGAIERFWENINFEDIKPINKVYEGLENIEDERERAIRASFRKKFHRF